jgi:hypothetical protein
MSKSLHRRLEALEAADQGGKWRVYAIDRYDDDADEGAIAAYEAVHGPLEPDGPKVLRVFLSQFCNRGE